MMMFSMDDMVPQNHMLRLIDKAINWNFIYDLVEEKYCPDNGRPSMDPVMLIKIPFIQYLYGIKSMRQTMKEIEVNVAYRWFLGLDMLDPIPHFSTFGKNYTRRFKDTDLFEQIFSKILEDCMKYKLVDTEQIFVDATHVKACANSKKMRKRIAREQTLWYEKELNKEIKKDRIAHDKEPLKDKKPPKPPLSGNGDADHPQDKEDVSEDVKTQKCSITDPESGWFRKGEHKHVFAYAIETACDKHGWILGYSVHPGNEHDSRTFKSLYDKLKGYQPEMIVADAGYKTPAIAHLLLEDEIKPLFPYKRPMTKEGFFKKYEYAYDEYYDCYICPENKILTYHTTNREGYREYKSCGLFCENCPQISQCTESKDHTKMIMRHVWEEDMEKAEENYKVPNLEKGIAVLEYLSLHTQGETLQDIKSALDISQTTAYRILNTLVRLDYLIYNEDTKRYKLSRKLLTLGFRSLNEHNLLETVLPRLRDLRDQVKETACFGVLGDRKGIFIEQAQGHHTFRFILSPGKPFDLHCSAPGKAIMAYLPNTVRDRYLSYMEFTRYNARTITTRDAYLEELEKVRKLGYAMDNEEELNGVICIGAPIFNYTGYPCGAIWISGPKDRLSKEVVRVSADCIRKVAQTISLELGYSNCLLYTSDAADE